MIVRLLVFGIVAPLGAALLQLTALDLISDCVWSFKWKEWGVSKQCFALHRWTQWDNLRIGQLIGAYVFFAVPLLVCGAVRLFPPGTWTRWKRWLIGLALVWLTWLFLYSLAESLKQPNLFWKELISTAFHIALVLGTFAVSCAAATRATR